MSENDKFTEENAENTEQTLPAEMISVCSRFASATESAVFPLAVGPQIQISRFSMCSSSFGITD